MEQELKSWPRPHFKPNGGTPLVFYVVFGKFDLTKQLSRSKYRVSGMPEWLELASYNQSTHRNVFQDYQSGPLWEMLKRDLPLLAREAEQASECIALRGEPDDSSNLDYFRDTIGIVSWLLDVGGVAIYDPQMLWIWSADEWREDVFEPNEPNPDRHTTILVSEEEDSTSWYHTRGMRKYGRPDLSAHHVSSDHAEGVASMIERFVEYQALGAVIADGEPVRMHKLPPGGICRHGGDLDDPDFNNVHIEIEWPDGGLR